MKILNDEGRSSEQGKGDEEIYRPSTRICKQARHNNHNINDNNNCMRYKINWNINERTLKTLKMRIQNFI